MVGANFDDRVIGSCTRAHCITDLCYPLHNYVLFSLCLSSRFHRSPRAKRLFAPLSLLTRRFRYDVKMEMSRGGDSVRRRRTHNATRTEEIKTVETRVSLRDDSDDIIIMTAENIRSTIGVKIINA